MTQTGKQASRQAECSAHPAHARCSPRQGAVPPTLGSAWLVFDSCAHCGPQVLEAICGPQGLSNADVTLRTRSCYFLTKLVKAMKEGVVPYVDVIVPGVQGRRGGGRGGGVEVTVSVALCNIVRVFLFFGCLSCFFIFLNQSRHQPAPLPLFAAAATRPGGKVKSCLLCLCRRGFRVRVGCCTLVGDALFLFKARAVPSGFEWM